MSDFDSYKHSFIEYENIPTEDGYYDELPLLMCKLGCNAYKCDKCKNYEVNNELYSK